MPIRERSQGHVAKLIRVTVLWYDVRKGTGRARTANGELLRIPLQAVKDARLLTLDAGQPIYVTLDELDSKRIDSLRLSET